MIVVHFRKPSIWWVDRFLKRFPHLSRRRPEILGYGRTSVTEKKLRGWYENLANILLAEHNLDAKKFLSDENGHRIFNIDESGFPLAGSNSRLKVITSRGTKNVYKVAPDSRTQITVLSYVVASGGFVNPLVIFPGTQPKSNLDPTKANDYSLGKSPNGWMNSEVFFTWLSIVFYEEIKDAVEFPILVLLDGLTSHINIAVSDFCRDHNIILFFFPPHASHVIQPLDVAVFGPLKKWYNQEVSGFSRRYNGLQITKHQFLTLFDPAWQKCISSPQNPISGFRKTGLIPFNPNA